MANFGNYGNYVNASDVPNAFMQPQTVPATAAPAVPTTAPAVTGAGAGAGTGAVPTPTQVPTPTPTQQPAAPATQVQPGVGTAPTQYQQYQQPMQQYQQQAPGYGTIPATTDDEDKPLPWDATITANPVAMIELAEGVYDVEITAADRGTYNGGTGKNGKPIPACGVLNIKGIVHTTDGNANVSWSIFMRDNKFTRANLSALFMGAGLASKDAQIPLANIPNLVGRTVRAKIKPGEGKNGVIYNNISYILTDE